MSSGGRVLVQGSSSARDADDPVRHDNDWDFRGCDTQAGVHGIHTYVAAMIPQLARRLIDDYAPQDGIVLDPFCGGGAVLAESVLSGRIAIGRDVNDLAVLVSKAKTTYVCEQEATSALASVLAVVKPGDAPVVDDKLAYWFKPEHLAPLHAIRTAITCTVGTSGPVATLLQTAFSSTVRDVSLTYRSEIRLRRMSPVEVANFQVDPLERFRERAEGAIAAVAQLPPLASASVEAGSVQAIDLPTQSVSTIVCSPPYGDERNGVSYTQFSRNMLTWLGYSADAIKESKALTLGWGNWERDKPPSPTLDAALQSIQGFPTSVQEAVSFYADYHVALSEMARVCRGPIVVVIGPRVLRDTVFDNGAITVDFMNNLGLPLRDRHRRNLPSKRLPRMRRFGAAINREDILVFQS